MSLKFVKHCNVLSSESIFKAFWSHVMKHSQHFRLAFDHRSWWGRPELRAAVQVGANVHGNNRFPMFSQPLSIKMPTGLDYMPSSFHCLVHLWGLETMHGWGALHRWVTWGPFHQVANRKTRSLGITEIAQTWIEMMYTWDHELLLTSFQWISFFPLLHCCSKSGWTATESYFFCMRRSLCCAQSGKSLHLEVFYGSIYSMVDMLRFLVIRWLNRHMISNVKNLLRLAPWIEWRTQSNVQCGLPCCLVPNVHGRDS